MPPQDNTKDTNKDLENVELDRASFLPEGVPDPVETRDPASEPVPRHMAKAWLFALPVLVLVIVGIVWLIGTERSARDDESLGAGSVGTSGAQQRPPERTDPEGLPRGDESPLNPDGTVVPVVTSMGHLVQKERYVGRPVEIGAIPVGDVKGPRTFEVGRLGARTLVLVDGDAAIVKELERGELVRLRGQIEAAGAAAGSAEGLSEDDRDAILGSEVLIRATLVQRQQDAGANQATIPESERTVPQPGRAGGPEAPRQQTAQPNERDRPRQQDPPGARQDPQQPERPRPPQ